MQIIVKLLEYLRDKQSPLVMYLHITVISLVIFQLILSNFLEFNDNGEISKHSVEYYGTWAHIITGILLAPITLLFIFFVLKKHGLKNFFAYLYGNKSQLIADLHQLKQLKPPESKPCGLASVVQGLGLCAMILVLLSGITWFIFWSNGLPGSDVFKEAHELLTGILIAYLIGHGGMGFIHIISFVKTQ